jgi:hypothetical protein
MRQWPRWGLVILVVAGLLAACGGGDKGDPVKVSRDFIVALWTGDQARVNALACKDTQWPFEGDSTLTIDTEHMKFEIVEETDDQVEVAVSGVVTFKGAEGQSEVRNLDELGIARFVLRDESGWKVCDIR